MKTSGIILSVVGVVAFLGGGTWEYMQYNTATKDKAVAEENIQLATLQHNQLVNEEASLKADLEQAQADTKELEAQLVVAQDALHQAQAGLAQAQSRLPGDTNNLDYDEILLAMAKTAGVKVFSLTTSDKQGKDIEGNVGFMDTTFTMEVKGGMADIIDLYNTIINDNSFRSALVEPLSVSQPLPWTDADRQAMYDQLYAEALDQVKAGLSSTENLNIVLVAIDELLSTQLDYDGLQQNYQDIIDKVLNDVGDFFGPDVESWLSETITQAIKNDDEQFLADNLVGIFAETYGLTAGELFVDSGLQMSPSFTGLLDEEINAVLMEQYPEDQILQIVTEKVTEAVQNKLNNYIETTKEALVDTTPFSGQITRAETEAEMASSSITVTVTAYQGGSNG